MRYTLPSLPGRVEKAREGRPCSERPEQRCLHTSSIGFLLGITALDDSFLLVLELLGSRHVAISPTPRVARGRLTRAVPAVHRGIASKVTRQDRLRGIFKTKGTWSGCRGAAESGLAKRGWNSARTRSQDRIGTRRVRKSVGRKM